MPERQSAYRQQHSTETFVTRVYNDLLLAADEGNVSALCLLDLTAAFDTVDHDLLMCRLERQFDRFTRCRPPFVQHVPFRQIVSGRLWKLHVVSGYHHLLGAPRFVLGPRLFILYTAELSDVVAAHDVTPFLCRRQSINSTVSPAGHDDSCWAT